MIKTIETQGRYYNGMGREFVPEFQVDFQVSKDRWETYKNPYTMSTVSIFQLFLRSILIVYRSLRDHFDLIHNKIHYVYK